MDKRTSEHPQGVVVLSSAFGAAICAIWGYDTIVCNGVVAGGLSALMRAGFLVFVHPPTLASCFGLFALFGVIGHWLAGREAIQARQKLLIIALPAISFVAGIAAGTLGSDALKCSLHPWA